MNCTYDEWKETLVKPADAERQTDIRLAIRAAVHVEHLTKNEIWDQFLGYLQGGLEECQKRVETYRMTLLSPYTVDHQEILRAKLVIADLEGQARAVQWIMEMPKAILETGNIARELFSATDQETTDRRETQATA